jgi:hypothetical protein
MGLNLQDNKGRDYRPFTLLNVNWSEMGYSLLLAAACYGGWKCVSWLVAVERRRERKLLRYLWPTAMVAWSWAMLWGTSFPSSVAWLGRAFDLLLIVFFVVNLPGAVLGNALLGILIDWPGPVTGVAGSAAVWLVWYAIIRLWERMKLRGEGTSLPRLGP